MTMLASWKQIVGVLLTVLWTTAFGVLSWRVTHAAFRLRQDYEQTAQLTQTLQQGAREVTQITQALASQTHEIDFLQGLVNVLPQEKGFVRTQRAISDEVESLRSQVARRLRGELNIVVDTKANKLYLKQGVNLLWQADCSVGKGGILKDPVTGRRWAFVTPRGQFEVLDKIEKPLWTKPDWAFVETHEPVPPPDDPKRKVEGELGAYVLNLGDGYLIHGTKTPELLGHPVSHGCVRLGADDLKKLYDTVSKGTKVYIY
jgi:L,D-transpeptidase ErfK/SrfK